MCGKHQTTLGHTMKEITVRQKSAEGGGGWLKSLKETLNCLLIWK